MYNSIKEATDVMMLLKGNKKKKMKKNTTKVKSIFTSKWTYNISKRTIIWFETYMEYTPMQFNILKNILSYNIKEDIRSIAN